MSKKKIGLLAFVLVAFISISIVGTFARYRSEGAGNGSAKVAKWAVKVNGTSIAAATETTFDAEITWTGNSNVVSTFVAPGMSGTANVEIDPDGAQVAMNYWIDVDTTALANPNFEVTDVTVGGNGLTKVALGTCAGGAGETETECTGNSGIWTPSTDPHAGEYTGTIALPVTGDMTADEKVTAAVTITWVDGNDATSNAADTTMGIAGGTKTIPITVTVEQKID